MEHRATEIMQQALFLRETELKHFSPTFNPVVTPLQAKFKSQALNVF